MNKNENHLESERVTPLNGHCKVASIDLSYLSINNKTKNKVSEEQSKDDKNSSNPDQASLK